MKIRLAFLCICFSLVFDRAFGQIEIINVSFYQDYNQTTDNTLGSMVSEGTDFNLTTENAGDLSAVTVTTPASSTVNLVQGLNGSPATQWNQNTTLTPVNGDFVFQTTGAGITSQSLTVTASGSFPSTPTLSGTSIETLAAANGTAAINLSLTYYTGSENFSWILSNAGTHAFVDEQGISSTSFSIPQMDLSPGQSYQLQLFSSNLQGGMIGSISANVQYTEINNITFGATATPEPSTMVMILFAGALFIPVLRKARVRAAQAP